MITTLIVAAAENGVIGPGNSIPRRLKTDQQCFKPLTMGKPIVMGRKTNRSPGRMTLTDINIVITRDPTFDADGPHDRVDFSTVTYRRAAAD